MKKWTILAGFLCLTGIFTQSFAQEPVKTKKQVRVMPMKEQIKQAVMQVTPSEQKERQPQGIIHRELKTLAPQPIEVK